MKPSDDDMEKARELARDPYDERGTTIALRERIAQALADAREAGIREAAAFAGRADTRSAFSPSATSMILDLLDDKGETE